jgi:hypothetical protein
MAVQTVASQSKGKVKGSRVKSEKITDRERLLRIISLCLSVEYRNEDPFKVEVKRILNILKKYLHHWKILEDFTLDAEALNRIASIISLQGTWIINRSTSLYIDPLLIELHLKMIDTEKLVNIFSKAWHPIVEMEGLSKKRVEEAADYWNQLIPMDERRLTLPTPSATLSSTTLQELIKMRIVSDESFNDTLHSFWQELRKSVSDREKVSYWSFIITDTYDETIYRAYLTSFLVTYGYAHMEINPIEEETFLIPYDEPKENVLTEPSVSIPIAINRNLWKSKRTGNLQ